VKDRTLVVNDGRVVGTVLRPLAQHAQQAGHQQQPEQQQQAHDENGHIGSVTGNPSLVGVVGNFPASRAFAV
jgi:hypothetical protein